MADAIEPAARKDGHARVRTAFQRSVLAILLAFNTLLVFALLAAGGVLPVAAAQGPVRGPGNYVCVTAKSAGQSYDVLYVLDQGSQQLHAFYRDPPQARQLTRASPRDLRVDFGGARR